VQTFANSARWLRVHAGFELTMEAFDQYWRKPSSIKRIVLRVIPDDAMRLVALKRGEVDIANLFRGELAGGVAAHDLPPRQLSSMSRSDCIT
jgi:ABC-type transport system substrate-binding protein